MAAGTELRGGELAGAGRLAATGARLGRGLVQKDELGMGSPLGVPREAVRGSDGVPRRRGRLGVHGVRRNSVPGRLERARAYGI